MMPYKQRAITNYRNKIRIREFSDNMHDDLKKRIFLFAAMVGIKEPLTIRQVGIIHEFLVKKFPDFGTDEITDALEMAASKQFEIDSEHYQSFNIVYLGKILDAYRTYRTEELRKERIAKDAEERKVIEIADEKRQPSSNSEYQKLCYDCIIEDIKEKKRLPIGACWEEAYLYLEGIGKIALTSEEKEMYMENVKVSLRTEYKEDVSGLKRILGSKILFRRACRTQYLKQYLRNNFKSDLDGS